MEQESISDKLRQAKMEIGEAIKQGILRIINECPPKEPIAVLVY